MPVETSARSRIEEADPASRGRDMRSALLLLVAGSFALRIAVQISTAGDPIFDLPMLDAEYAVDWAHRIREGDFWGSLEGTAYFRTPLYAWWLAAVFALPGPDLATARVFQAALGALAAGWLAGIAGRRFGVRAFWTTGLLAATAWPLLLFGRELLIAPLAFFLTAAVLRVLDGATPAWGPRRAFATGALIGLGALARANLLALAVPAGFLALAHRPGRVARASALLAGIAICVAPIAVRNRLVSGDWIALSSQGGINLWIGNHPDADGMSAELPGFSFWRNEDVDAALTIEHGRPLGPAEQDAYFRGRALDFFRTRPGEAIGLLLRKTYLFLQGYEIRNNRDLYDTRARDPILSTPLPDFGWIAPLAVVGFAATWRRRRELAHLWGTGLAMSAAVVLFFVCSRYRLPAWPAYLVYAGAGGAALLDPGASGGRRLALTGALLLAVAATRIDLLGVRSPDPSQSLYQTGNAYARTGRDADAERAFRDALRLEPRLAEARHHLGALLLRQGRLAEALPELRAAASALPRSFRVRRTLAEALEASGDFAAAVEVRREALALSAGAASDRVALAVALGMNGEYAESLALFREVEGSGEATDGAFFLNAGQSALAAGEVEQGLRWLGEARADPETRAAAFLAVVRIRLAGGDGPGALAELDRAPPELRDTPTLLRLRAIARYQVGDREGAMRDLETVLAAEPGDEASRRRLEDLRRERP